MQEPPAQGERLCGGLRRLALWHQGGRNPRRLQSGGARKSHEPGGNSGRHARDGRTDPPQRTRTRRPCTAVWLRGGRPSGRFAASPLEELPRLRQPRTGFTPGGRPTGTARWRSFCLPGRVNVGLRRALTGSTVGAGAGERYRLRSCPPPLAERWILPGEGNHPPRNHGRLAPPTAPHRATRPTDLRREHRLRWSSTNASRVLYVTPPRWSNNLCGGGVDNFLEGSRRELSIVNRVRAACREESA